MPVRLHDSARDGYPIIWDNIGDQEVTVYAEGEQGDVHNKAAQPNNGRGGAVLPRGLYGFEPHRDPRRGRQRHRRGRHRGLVNPSAGLDRARTLVGIGIGRSLG